MEDPYKILECSKDITNEELKQHYNKLVLKYHPDRKTGNIKKYNEIKMAYESITKKVGFMELYVKFKNKYLDSDEELVDIIKLYNKFKGNIKQLIDNHILCEYEDEDRIREIIEKLILEKKVKRFIAFKKRIPKSKKVKRNNLENELSELLFKNEEKRKDFIENLEEKYCNQLKK